MLLENKTIIITGASRGIGKAIALKLAKEKANIVIAAKSVEEDPRLGGTIFKTAEEVEALGGKALAVQCDIRNETNIAEVVQQAVAKFGGIDALINNASAINLSKTEQLESKRFDLMFDINVRGTMLLSAACIPYLKQSNNPHIINLSPPIKDPKKWLKNHTAYTISKYNMTLIALGLSEELIEFKIAANSLWPKTTIATAAVNNLLGGEQLMKMSRKPEILADCVHYILQQPSATFTGQTLLDEDVLSLMGISNLSKYAYVEGTTEFYPDIFI